MPLVDYPDSETERDDSSDDIGAQPVQIPTKAAIKRKRSASAQDDLPPLPAAFHDLYSTNARVSTGDNPKLHGGRKRTVPHIEGNWPSHVYLEWFPSQTASNELHSLIHYVKNALESQNATRTQKLPVPEIVPSLQSDLGASLPLHVSLSRTLQVKTEDRESFLETLERSLRRATVRTFQFHFQGLKWVSNFDRNRWFLVLSIERPVHDELNKLLGACNDAAEKCGHPGLYTGGKDDGPMPEHRNSKHRKTREVGEQTIDRSAYFHVSIAWNLTEPDPAWVSLIHNIDIKPYIQSLEAPIGAVKAKVGNVVHTIALGHR